MLQNVINPPILALSETVYNAYFFFNLDLDSTRIHVDTLATLRRHSNLL